MVKLSVSALTYQYPDGPRAVDDVSLDLGPGELAVVIGPNGAGKSTLVKLVAGLVPASNGRVEVDGAPLAGLPHRARARAIAVVPQTLRALPDVSVKDFVLGGRYAHFDVWRRARTSDFDAARRALEASDVAELADRLLNQLSGGQRQRVMFARALAQEAELLLVDEPTASLDPEHQLATFELLVRLTAGGRSALCVTHDLNLASQFATSIVLMDAGRIAARGAPAEVLRAEVLEPVYGANLRFGSWPGADGAERPFVLPWRSAVARDTDDTRGQSPGRSVP